MPRFAANLRYLFQEVPFAERFEHAATAGFRGVEYQFPYEKDAMQMRDLLTEFGLQFVLLNAPPGNWEWLCENAPIGLESWRLLWRSG